MDWHRVDDGIGAHHDEGQDLRECHDAHGGAHHTGDARIDEVLRRNGSRAVAQRLVCADEHAVILDHARHGGQRHQRRHQEEDEGEDVGDGVDATRVSVIGGRALALGAVERIDVGQLDFVDLLLRILQLRQGVAKLLVRLGLALLVGAQAVGVFDARVTELGAALLQLGRSLVELCLCVPQLAIGRRATLLQLPSTGINLALALVHLSRALNQLPATLLHLRPPGIYLGARGLRLGKLVARVHHGSIALGDARLHLVARSRRRSHRLLKRGGVHALQLGKRLLERSAVAALDPGKDALHHGKNPLQLGCRRLVLYLEETKPHEGLSCIDSLVDLVHTGHDLLLGRRAVCLRQL